MAARPDDPADTDCEEIAPVELMMENRAESRPYPTYSSPPCPETVVFITPNPDVGYEHSKIGKLEGVSLPSTYLPNWNFGVYANRLKTFSLFDWEYKYGHTAEEMAAQGFVYMIDENILICVLCFTKYDKESYNKHDVLKEHKKKQQELKLKCETSINNKIQKKLFCESYYLQFLDYETVSGDFEGDSEASLYSRHRDRVNTFGRGRGYAPEVAETLSESGFLLGGDLSVKCFYCSCTFTYDFFDHVCCDLWIMHALLKPDCKFLIMNKGNEFVRKLLDKNTDKLAEYKELLKKDTGDLGLKFKILNVRHCYLLNIKRRDYLRWTSESDRVQFRERIRYEPEGPKSDSRICEELACQICKINIVQVVILNCHHATTCIQCTAPLTSCPTCDVKITRVLSVRLYLTKYFPGLCRICHRKYLSVVYLGCRHFVSCYDCAIEKNTCAVCNKFYFGLLSVRIFYDA